MTPTLLLRSDLRCRIFLILFGILAMCAQNAAAQACSGIRGKAFADYNYNGLDDDNGSVGVGGIEVKLCDGGGVVGSTVTATDGSYAFPTAANSAAYRIEFKIPTALSIYKFSATGLKNAIATQFVTAPNCTINVAVAVPADYCQTNPYLIAPIYVNGDPLIAAGSAKDSTTLIATPFNVPQGNDYGQQKKLLKTAQIGSTWGVAFQRSRKIIISTATLKRHVGFGPQGTGGIYFTDFSNPMTPSVLGSLSLTTAGTDPRVTDGVPLPSDPTLPSNDVTAYAQVGKMSLGGATMSDDDKTLYTINLKTNELVKIDISALANDGVTLPTMANVTTAALPTPCGATGVFRPWAVKYWHGKLYIGGVCSAETSKNGADLSASIYCYNGVTFSLIKSFPLNYTRGIVKNNSPTFNKWLPWEDNYTLMLQNGETDFLYPQPILSDIEFDTDGSMILGFTDRMGTQSAFRNYVPVAGFTFVLANGVTGGDIMRLCLRNSVYEVENTPAAGCSTTGGATDGQGPHGGEYYWSDYWTYNFFTDNNPPTPFPFHNEIAQGGLTMIAGKSQVVSTVHDPISEAQTGGFTWFDNTTGKRPRSYEAFISTNASFQNRGYAGQANGLGDIHPACDPAPICIGNRVWADCNGNGQQDADEKGIAGVTVTLTRSNCLLPMTTVTDNNGNYEFCGLAENTNYYLRFGTAGSFNLATQKLTVGGIPYVVSPLDLGIGTNPDENDSDAELPNAGGPVCENDLPFIRVTTAAAGCTQNNYDIGLVAPKITTLTAATTPTSCSGETNGSITVTAVYTPATAIEYSKDNGATWQSSNIFANLPTGLCTIKVRIAGSTAVNTCTTTGETITATVVAGAIINAPVTTADDICRYELTSRLNGMTAACDACPGNLLPKITWWTAAVGGVKVGEGSPFCPIKLPVGAPGYVDPAVAGTTVFYAQCECGARCVSDRTATNFTVLPRPAPVITGDLFPCPDATVTYTTPSVVGSSWVWTLPTGGGTIVSTNANSVTIRWSNLTGAGPFSVRVVETSANNCAHGTSITISSKQTNMVCLSNVNVSVDHNCQVNLAASSLLGGTIIGASALKVEIVNVLGQVLYMGTGSVTIDVALHNLLGRTVKYRIIEPCSGNSCWGNILFEDKTSPQLTCPNNVTVSCAQVDGGLLPIITGQPTIKDCSGTFISYNDITRKTDCTTPFTALPADLMAIMPTVFPNTGDIIEIILRKFSVKDYYNNVSTCYQYIFVRRANLTQVLLPNNNFEVSCANFNGTIDPSVTGLPMIDIDGDFNTGNDRVSIPQAACRLTANYTDQIIPFCGGSKKLIRTWTVTDYCVTGTGAMTKTGTQIISITDKAPPSVSAHITQYYRFSTGLVGIDTAVNFSTTGVQCVYPLGNSYNCGAKARFTIKGKDNSCVKAPLSFKVSDSRVRLLAGYPQYNATTCETTAVYEIETDSYQDIDLSFSATNSCQTVTINKDFRLKISDNVAPNAVCKGGIQATLSSNGTARVYTASINNYSTDNCGIDRMEVRRMQVCGDANTNFGDYMDFSCCDVLDTVMVVLRVWDYAGNYTDCMTTVTVADKISPTCYAPPRRIISCQDLTANNIDSYGSPSLWDNCGIKDTLYTAKEELDNCGIGYIKRKWVVSDYAGFKDSCQQIIEVRGISDFTVDFPDDIIAGCFATVMTKEQARTALLNNSPSMDGHIINNGCGVLMVEVKDDTLTAVPDACYKILRKFTVVDWCKYNPNNTNINQLGTAYGQPICGDIHSNPSWMTQNLPAWQSLNRGNCNQLPIMPQERCFRDADGLGGTATWPEAFSDGVMSFTQIIKILDNTPPVILPYPSDTIIKSASVDCIDHIRLSIKATDQCIGERVQDLDFVSYYWEATDVATNTVVKTGTTNEVFLGNQPFGKTCRIGWRINDRCGNTVFGTQTVKLVDIKAPALVCRDINAELSRGTNGAWVVVTLADLFMSTADNCTPRTFLESKLTMERAANSTNTYPTLLKTITFDCLDANKEVPIRLWTYDEAKNVNFCEVKVRVQDNLNACSATTTASINGTIKNDKNVDVANVVVTASTNGATVGTVTSTAAGNFSFTTGISTGGNYALKADRTDNVLNGVTTLDIALMSKHILDVQLLTSPYRIIAGDVNRDGELSGIDMLQTRRVILRVTPQFAGGKTWRFVDKRYIFDYPDNPLAEDFPETVVLTNIPTVAQAHFIGIKMGDVSGNAWSGAQNNEAVVRGANKALVLEADDVKMEAGKEYTVTIRATDFTAQGFQFTLNSADGLDILKVINGNLPDMSETNFGLFKNALTLSWNGNFSEKTAEILTIVVKAKKNMDLSDALTIGSNLTNAEGFDAKGALLDVKLSFKGQNKGESFALYQNQPNPFFEETKIAFYLPSDSKAKLIISDASGKVLKVVHGNYKKGYNEIPITKSELTVSGMVFYRLETPTHAAARKMIILN